jgi:hypothetical protein
MSSVSSVGSNAGLYSWLQALGVTGTTNSPTTTTPVQSGQDSDGDDDGSTASTSSSVQGSGGHHGHGGHHFASKIESAVTDALNSAKAAGSTTDPNQIIQTVIESILSQGKAAKGSAASDASGSDGAANAGSSSATDPNSPAAQQAAFQQLLSSYGVNPAQFQKDFQTAVQTSLGSNAPLDFAKLFQSLPPGTLLNTTG